MLISLISLAAAIVSLGLSADGVFVGGRHTQIDYNTCGLWNDKAKRRGFVMDECCPIDATWPGTPWQQLSVSYRQGSTTYNYRGNTNSGCNYVVKDTEIIHTGTEKIGIQHTFEMGRLVLIKKETWDFRGKTVVIEFEAKYPNEKCTCAQLTDLRIMHAVDPDQDRIPFNTYSTYNDVHYPGGNRHYAHAVGPVSCHTMAYGHCSRPTGADYTEDVGFTVWSTSTYSTFSDPNNALQDHTLHYRYRRASLNCDQSVHFRFVVTWDRSPAEARDNFIRVYRQVCKCKPLYFSPHPRLPPCRNICPCDRADRCECKYKRPHSAFSTPVLSAVAALTAASKRTPTSGPTARKLTLDEEIALVGSLDAVTRTCPALDSSSLRIFASLGPNIRPAYNNYNRRCKTVIGQKGAVGEMTEEDR